MAVSKTVEAVPLPGLVIRFARDAADLTAIRELREQVFGIEQGVPNAGDEDPDDWRSIHILATLPGGVIGAGRLTLPTQEQPSALITWVATLARYRRRGIGAAIMHGLIDAADSAGAPAILLSAQTHALRFYRDLGFVPYGERFMAGGIEHQFMYRRSPGGLF
ncbi:MAG TPA: GNAT family N-acetyltransferase [Thermomicrobiales bacterium]|nr:GNAT family N-acetyltransferase [Thermomicrobiales bacterium]